MTDKWGRIWGVDYQNPRKWISIKIDFIDAEICSGTLDDDSEPVYISMQELQAINEKVKELRMGAINRFRDRYYELKVKEDEIIFEHKAGERYIFDLKNKKVKTNVMWTSDEKAMNRLIKDFKKELGWE